MTIRGRQTLTIGQRLKLAAERLARGEHSNNSSKRQTEMKPNVTKLTPAQRRRIVTAPFNALGVRRFGTSYPWAGVLMDRDFSPTTSRKTKGGNDDITKFAVGAFTEDDIEALR